MVFNMPSYRTCARIEKYEGDTSVSTPFLFFPVLLLCEN